MTIQEALNIAIGLHQSGLLDQAEPVYRKVLSVQPGNADALHLLGLVENQKRNFGLAESLMRKALEKCSHEAFIWSDLALVLMNLDRMNEAQETCRKSLELNPNQHMVHHYLGIIHMRMDQFDRALGFFEKALGIEPDHFESWMYKAEAMYKAGRHAEALELNGRLLAKRPGTAFLHNQRGSLLSIKGQVKEALEAFKQAVALDSNFAEAFCNLGNMYGKLNQTESAVQCFNRAIQLNPKMHIAHNNLGNAFKTLGQYDPALACYQKALALCPDRVTYNNLGNLYKDMGQLDAAIEAYRKSIGLEANPEAHSNLIFTMQYHPGCDMAQIREELDRWSEIHAKGLCREPAIFPSTTPDRLKIGFVSEDLRSHPVGRFMLSLLANMDRARFLVACYSNALVHDALSDELKSHTDLWVPTYGMTNEEVSRRVRADGIHILIDLTAHTAGNRLSIFARKPAPVQISWLAYCGSTGLKEMDFRISDPYMDPPGMFDRFHSEQTLLLPRTYWCYPTPPWRNEPTAPPCKSTGRITFGCLNNFCKISAPAIECWIEILKKSEGARLVVHAGEGSCRSRFTQTFEKAGVDPARIGFIPYQKQSEYFDVYRGIDIALDPFPYNGGTTSCDAIWMGVPVVTLMGDRPVGRAGLSILSNLGMTELAARDTGDYIQKTLELASDIRRLEELRRTLRERMMASPLMDGAAFAGDFAELLMNAWKRKAGSMA